MLKFIIVDDYRGEVYGYETLDDAVAAIHEQLDSDGHDDHAGAMEIFSIGEHFPVDITRPSVMLRSETAIPAPLPGETVSDYARRLTGA